MKEFKKITTPLTEAILNDLVSGDNVLITGTIYTGRDAAHKKLVDAIGRGEALPFDLAGQIIYFVGPSPAKPGQVIGSAGPTTSYRMDAYSPLLISLGLKGMIGKGMRDKSVKDAMVKHKAVYFGAIGGLGALISKTIKEAEVIAYPELGPEAVRRLYVVDFPATVINDIHGGDLYETGVAEYRTISL